ncbi:MAG: TolC family protein [Longimicrobiales bacterium]
MNNAALRYGRLAALLATQVGALPILVAAQQDNVPVVTLSEARRRALAVDPAAVLARGQLETTAWEQRAARVDLLTPNVTAGTSFTRFSEPFINFGTFERTPNATNAELRASYTLLGAGKFAELKRARAAVESAAAGETASHFRIALMTDAAYYAVLADRELARVVAERLKRALEAFGVARLRVVAGDAIATDSLQLLLEANRARLAILKSDSAVAVSRLRLGRQIGLAGPVDPAALDSAALPALPITQEQAIVEYRTRGPELEAARAAERQAAARIGVERESYLPAITVGATTGAYDAEFFPSAAKRSQVVVGVSLPIWNAGQRELAVARARAQSNVARAQREQHERAAAEVIAEAYHGYQTARAGVELAQVGVTVATENFRVQRTRYREGATTILDLLEAQVALSEAEATLVQSRYATRLALARMEALLGRRLVDTPGQNPTNR